MCVLYVNAIVVTAQHPLTSPLSVTKHIHTHTHTHINQLIKQQSGSCPTSRCVGSIVDAGKRSVSVNNVINTTLAATHESDFMYLYQLRLAG